MSVSLPVFCGAEERDPGIEGFSLRGGREVHGFRETGEEQLQQLSPEQTNAGSIDITENVTRNHTRNSTPWWTNWVTQTSLSGQTG